MLMKTDVTFSAQKSVQSGRQNELRVAPSLDEAVPALGLRAACTLSRLRAGRPLPTLASVDPAARFRRALARSKPSTPSLSNIVRLADRIPADGHARYRNTDPQTRQTSLHLAANAGRADILTWLLDEGTEDAEVSRDVLGETVLHVAAAKGRVEILEMYLARFPFVRDWVNSRGMTALHVAAMKGELEAAQFLLEAGSDVDAPDLDGNSPLHFASSWGHVAVIKLLIDCDCDVEQRNGEGFSAAEYAYSFGVLKELETLIRQHIEQAKAATRASRRSKSRSNSQTLRAKRIGSQSGLSIALPPLPSPAEDHNGERSAASSAAASPALGYGLGLAEGPPPAHRQIPRLGEPIPPTPQPMSPISPGPQPRFPLPSPGTPSEPHTPISPHPNTTSPQPSPLPSPASSGTRGSRPSTPKLSPVLFRRFSRTLSNQSPLSTPTSAAPSSPGSAVVPSSASAHSGASPATHTTSPESAQTATPTPASPTPVSGSSRRLSTLDPFRAPLRVAGEYPAPQHPAHARVLSDASLVSSESSVESGGGLPAEGYSLSAQPFQDQDQDEPHPAAPHPGSPPTHNKLVRKSRSHAHAPSLSAAAAAQGEVFPPSRMLLGASVGGGRSVSGPQLGRSRTSVDDGTVAGTGTGSSTRSSFEVAEAVVDDLREREKSRGHKLRKENRERTASSSEGGGGVGGMQQGKEHRNHGGRLARALGFRK